MFLVLRTFSLLFYPYMQFHMNLFKCFPSIDLKYKTTLLTWAMHKNQGQ